MERMSHIDKMVTASSQRIDIEEYWLHKLSGELVKSIFPYDIPGGIKPGKLESEAVPAIFKFRLDNELFARLMKLSKQSLPKLHMILIAGLTALLSRYSSNDDIILGTSIYKQKIEAEFINTVLPLRNRLHGNMTFKELILQVRENLIEADKNQNYPIDLLLQKLKIPFPIDDDFPLFDVSLLLENLQDKRYIEHIRHHIRFSFLHTDGYIKGIIAYNPSRYKKEAIERIGIHFKNVLNGALSNPDLPMTSIDILTEEEKQWLLVEVNDTAGDYPGECTIHQLFQQQVEKTPGHTAVVCNHNHISYRELDDQSSRLAHRLREKGVKPGIIAAISMARSIEMIIGILGILKAGGAYLPIDPGYPDERIDYILKDSNAKVLVNEWSEGTDAAKLSELKEERPTDLCYVIYTSGSTGNPKGVMVDHKGLVNYIWWAAKKYVRDERMNFPLYTSISFDLTITSIFTPLITGNAIIIYDEEKENRDILIERIIDDNRVEAVKVTPSHLKMVKDKKAANSCAQQLIVGGEELESQLARDIAANFANTVEIYNEYGPTEAVVGSMIYKFDFQKDNRKVVPIGVPIDNAGVYILDRSLNPVPVGVTGELHLSGDGLARGYLNRPELTAKRFLPVSHRSYISRKIYKTGDLAQWLPEGNVEFSGRIDQQVKIRGFRIEPKEIETSLMSYDGIKEAMVLGVEDNNNERILCAYIVSDNPPEVSKLREFLSLRLPSYMIPAYFIPLEKIPLTPNGKVDRKALPEPGPCPAKKYTTPRNRIEEKLVTIWQEILGDRLHTAVGIDDNFFEVGGHSLKAAILASRIHKELDTQVPLTEIFTHQTIRELSHYIEGAEKDKFAAIEPVEKREYYVLSSAQKRLYFLQQMELTGKVYNISQVVSLAGELDIEKLKHTFKELIQRHESLRTSFVLVNEEPVQKIHEDFDFEIEYFDSKITKVEEGKQAAGKNLPYEPSDPKSQELRAKSCINDFIRPFDLARTPLLRVGLMPLENKKYLLMVDMHHIISDGVSHTLLEQNFINIYKGEELPPLTLQYKDYAEWQNSEKQKKTLENQEEYWLKEFEADIPVLNMPTDYPRPAVQSFEGNSLRFEIHIEETKKINNLAMNEGTTLYTVLVAVFYILLAKITGQKDIVIGTPVAGRRHVDLEQIIGIFVNTLALRNFPESSRKFVDFLHSVKENLLNAFENQDYPFEDIVDQVPLNRDVSRNPLFDVMFALQNMDFPEVKITGLDLKPYGYEDRISKFDLTLQVVESGDNLLLSYEYCTNLFKKETIERFISYFKNIITSIFVKPAIKISDIEMIPAEEKRQILFDFNDTDAQYPNERTIHELFEEQAARTPGNIAIVYENIQLTYGELKQRANQLAYFLKEKGVGAETIVGIMVERSVEMIIGLLGILTAGGAYLPLDSEFPVERIKYMLIDSGTKILLAESPDQGKAKAVVNGESTDLILISDCLSSSTSNSTLTSTLSRGRSANLAYIIYTSGSTGKAKGVLTVHSNVTRVVKKTNYIDLRVEDRVLQLSNYAFDGSVFDIYGALLNGAALVLIEKEKVLAVHRLAALIKQEQVTVFFITTALFNVLVDLEKECLKNTRKILFGGERVSVEHSGKALEYLGRGRVIHVYGPTETTVYATYYFIDETENTAVTIPIGKPISNTTLYILDRNLHPVPVGVSGEIYIGGGGTACGYLNSPELTGEKFIKNPFSKRDMLYRSGDLARWMNDGNIEFIDRSDHQVKIRGFRIETGEIETHLLTNKEIKEAVVTARETGEGDRYLCAYYVSEKKLILKDLKEYLANKLPPYMIPAYFVPLKNLPLTPNGKIDRKSLPGPEEIALESGVEYLAPRNEVEKMLVKIWQNVLGRDGIGINDNFFEIGGDSIKTIQIASRIKKAGYEIHLRDIFENPQISVLAPLVRKLERIPDQGVITGTVCLTPIQHWFFKSQFADNHHFNQAVMFYSQEGFEEEAVRAVFLKLQEYHDALRMTYHTHEGEIIQENHGLDYPFSLQVFDYRQCEDAITALESMSNQIQASIDLKTGPLMKLGLFHLEDGDRLLIVIHHLVIDGISWRILFEDIETLFQQFKKKKPLALPLKTDSFKSWSEKLHPYANNPKFLKEKAYWRELESMVIPPLEKDFSAKDNLKKDEVSLSFNLPEKESHLLLTKVNNAFGTEVNDILLTALGLSVNKTFGNNRLLVALEGHGREEILDEIDISRTIGWFTSIYPLVLDISSRDGLDRRIKETKESLRRAPNKGIGYGILEYLTKREYRKNIEFKLNPQITFNYLGQFDSDIRQRSFEIAKEAYGNTMSLEGQRTSEIEISGIITDRRLVVTIIYNKRHYKPETMQTFLDNYKLGLCDTISYCVSMRERELTPSDLTYSELSIEKCEELSRKYSIEDIYILSPMQEGKLFYTFYNPLSSGGSVQLRICISGNLDVTRFERSINELFMRYDILRAAFVYEGIKVPIQIILKERKVEFLYQDLREKMTNENKESVIDEFAERDRMRSFDLRKNVLMRTAVLQTGDRDYEVIWSFHHILMDGWCLGILIEEFFEIYNHLGENKPYQLPPVTPYREYIRWLMKQDEKEPEAYWKKYLEGYAKETGLLKKKSVKTDQKGYQFERESFYLSEDKTSALHLLAAESQVTLNTIVQAIWGIILSKYNRGEDVVFGAVVSGRPSEIPGVESMVGLFINTAPVRMSFKRGITFQQLILQVQEKAIESEPYHYYPLSRIQAGSILKRNLLDHILVFENYPLGEQVVRIAERTQTKAFDVLKVTEYTQPDYNFHVVISPGNSLGIEFRFNSLAYDRNFVKKIALHIEEIVNTILYDRDTRLEDIGISDERAKPKFSDQNKYTADFGF